MLLTAVVSVGARPGRDPYGRDPRDAPDRLRRRHLGTARRRGERGHEIHDLHVCALTLGVNVALAHLVVAENADHHALLDGARDVLRECFGTEHATLQVESKPAGPSFERY